MSNLKISLRLVFLPVLLIIGISSGFNSNSAYNYAEKYYDKVVSDGYFWKQSDVPSYLGAGTPVPEGGYDCAHFVSCVIGAEPNENGGGLDIPSRTVTYGEPGANNLCNLLISSGYGIKVNSIDQLQRCDVIFYDWDGNGRYDHSAVYLGNYKVAAHSSSVWNASWSLGGAQAYCFIHINPGDVSPPQFQNIQFFDSNGNQIIGNIPVDDVLQIKGDYTPGDDGTQQETGLWIITNSSDGLTVYTSTINSGDRTSIYLERNILVPETCYSLSVSAANTNNMWSTPTIISFTTVSQSECNDTDGDGVPDNQNPPDGQTGGNNQKTILFNGNTVVVESGENDTITYFGGILPTQAPTFGKSIYGVFVTRIEVESEDIITLKYTFPENLPTGTTWCKYIESALEQKWVEYPDVVITDNTVIIQLQDGGEGDADGTVNGVLVDPSGPVVLSFPSSDDNGGGSKCFIATAAFGSPLAKQIQVLRQFRDKCLLTNYPGKKFVAWYYKKGPVAGKFIQSHPKLRILVRIFLYPLIIVAYLIIKGLFWPILLLFCSAISLKFSYSSEIKNLH